MRFLRSLIFQIVFVLNCTFWFLAAMLAWVMPTAAMFVFARGWARSSIWLHSLITGARVEIRGRERIPQGAVLVAAKHYSAWETMALLLFFPRITYTLKQQLIRVPLFGWHLLKARQIPIDRAKGSQALAKMQARAKSAAAEGCQMAIFPEGTRRMVGAEPAYKYGVARLYALLDVPCVPIALTSGLAWPRNTFFHNPMPIIVEFLEPIPPGLSQQEFQSRLQLAIETNTNRLLREAGYTGPLADPATGLTPALTAPDPVPEAM